MNDRIKEDLVKSMKEQDKFKTSVLRMLKSAIQTEKINKNKDLTDDEIILVIKKQIKIRTSSLEEYEKYNRLDLANDLKKEIKLTISKMQNKSVEKIVQERYLKFRNMGEFIRRDEKCC